MEVDTIKAVLGGLSIALATIIAVLINVYQGKKSRTVHERREKSGFASVISSELFSNFTTLMDLNESLAQDRLSADELSALNNFETMGYEKHVDKIGHIGSGLSYIIVDTYGQIHRMKEYIAISLRNGHQDKAESIQRDCLKLAAKTLSTSIVILFYADYLNGKKYFDQLEKLRKIWIQDSLERFHPYIQDTESSDLNQCVQNKVGKTRQFVSRNKDLQSQIYLRALAIAIQNQITDSLGIGVNKYDKRLEQEYLNLLD